MPYVPTDQSVTTRIVSLSPTRAWYRKGNDSWYAEIAGQQVRLAKGKANRAEAVKQFHLLVAGTAPAKPSNFTAAEVCDLYLRQSEREHEPDTFTVGGFRGGSA